MLEQLLRFSPLAWGCDLFAGVVLRARGGAGATPWSRGPGGMGLEPRSPGTRAAVPGSRQVVPGSRQVVPGSRQVWGLSC